MCVCDRWCVTKLYVKDGVTHGVTKMVCDKEVCEDAEAEAEAKAEEAAGTDLKTRTPRNLWGMKGPDNPTSQLLPVSRKRKER